MKRLTLFVVMLLTYAGSYSHGIDISTIMLVEQKDGLWTLQVSSSLAAFRQEVLTHFAAKPYTTREEFKEQLLEHLCETLKISVNDQESIPLEQGDVKLGHETHVFFDQIKLPISITSIEVAGNMFKDIHYSKTRLLILKKGFEKKQFILKKSNYRTLKLTLEGKRFVAAPIKTKKSTASFYHPHIFLSVIAIVVSIIIFVFRIFRKEKSLKRKGNTLNI